MEPTFPLLLIVHHYFADPSCRLENIEAAPRSRILFVSFCRSGGNTNCFVDMRYVIMIHHVTTIYSRGDTILTLWLSSRCRDPWSSRGWSFTRYKDNFVTKRSSLQASTQSMSNQIFTDETIVNSSVEGWHILKSHHSLSVFFLILALQTAVSIWAAQSSDTHMSWLLTRRAKVKSVRWSSCLTITLFEKRSAD